MKMSDALVIIREFDTAMDDAIGLYLDAKSAMVKFADLQTELQIANAAQFGMSIAELDNLSFTYGTGDPNDPQSLHLHATTQGNLKARNSKGGKNHLLLGQRFIVDLYTFWEDSYRTQIAEALNRDRDTIRSNIFGDLRLMRNSIIQHRGIALPEIIRCKSLVWFGPGDIIDISDDSRFHSIITETRRWLEAFGSEVSGSAPGLIDRHGPSGHRYM